MRVLGIDPGYGRLGYAVLDRSGSSLSAVASGLIETDKSERIPDRLKKIHERISDLISEFSPECLATEAVFFAANRKTAMGVIKALGVIVLAAAEAGIPWVEYKPSDVKLTVTGSGNADKKQVQYMVTRILNLPEPPKQDDVADALAVAICHAHNYRAVAL